jgi:hypothetical protein
VAISSHSSPTPHPGGRGKCLSPLKGNRGVRLKRNLNQNLTSGTKNEHGQVIEHWKGGGWKLLRTYGAKEGGIDSVFVNRKRRSVGRRGYEKENIFDFIFDGWIDHHHDIFFCHS